LKLNNEQEQILKIRKIHLILKASFNSKTRKSGTFEKLEKKRGDVWQSDLQ